MQRTFRVALLAIAVACLTAPALARGPLSFEERVKAQEAIERVYYNHRIWPKENLKPGFLAGERSETAQRPTDARKATEANAGVALRYIEDGRPNLTQQIWVYPPLQPLTGEGPGLYPSLPFEQMVPKAVIAAKATGHFDRSPASAPASRLDNKGEGLKQFRSGGHVLAFEQGGMLLASRDHMARVEMVRSNLVAPVIGKPLDGDADESGAIQGAAPLTKVSYPGVWDGVTVTYEDDDGAVVKTTYRVEAGAGESAIDCIRLLYNRPVSLDENGNLVLLYDAGQIVEMAPVAFQEIDGQRKKVAVSYIILDDGEVGFTVTEEYDPAYPLVFDCIVVWNTFLGGNGSDVAYGIAVDGGGNVYLAGYSDATWGSPVRTYTAGADAYAAKLDSSGNIAWSTFLGGSGHDFGNGIAVDGSGNVYVTGYSNATWGSPIRAYAVNDAFAAKLDGSGNLIWNTFLGGSGGDYSTGIALDGSGNVYMSGVSDVTWDSPVRDYSGSQDAFVAKLSGAGALTWNTFLGGSGSDQSHTIAMDGSGNVYVAGSSDATWGSPVSTYTAPWDAFAAKLTGLGTLTWNTFLGGSGGDFGHGIAVDESGNVYVTGDSNATWGSPVRAFTDNGTSRDAFAAKLSSTGTLTWNTFLGGSESDESRGIALDGSGNVYVVGSSDATWGSPVRAYTLGTDAFAGKLSSTGALTWNTFLGGSYVDAGCRVALDSSRDLYVAGASSATWGSPVVAYTAGIDIFVAKITVTLDASALSLDDPVSGGTKDTGVAFSPKASFSNSGTVPLTNLLVRYRIIGPAPSTGEVYNQNEIVVSLNCGASSQVTFPTATIAVPGAYTIFAKAELAGDEVPANDEIFGSLIICYLEPPTIFGDSSGCANPGVVLRTGVYSSYQWLQGGADISGATAQSYTVRVSGTYSVRVTDSNGCMSTSAGHDADISACPPPILAPEPAFTMGTSNAVFWSAVPDATAYEAQVSHDNFQTVDQSSGSITSTNYTFDGLSDGMTYQYRVKAKFQFGDGDWSEAVSSTQDTDIPISSVVRPLSGGIVGGQIFAVTGTASDGTSGISLVEVSWDGSIWHQATGTTSWSYDWTLPADGNYTLLTRSTDLVGHLESPHGIPVTVKNRPAPPTNLMVTDVPYDGGGSIELSWTLSSDDGSGLNYIVGYSIYRANAGTGPFSQIGFVPAGTGEYLDATAGVGIERWYKVRAITEADVWPNYTDSSIVGPVAALDNAPLPVNNLQADLTYACNVRLTWIESPSLDILLYNIYYDNGTGTVNYSTPLGTVSAPATTWVSSGLALGTRYIFSLRAKDMAGQEDSLTANLVSISTTCGTQPRAEITQPPAGRKIKGTAVTVRADLIQGTPAETGDVLMQYRQSGGSTWTDMIPAAGEQNPDSVSPYVIHWDVSLLPNGDYDLRGVASAWINGAPDPAPPFVTVTVNNAFAQITESNSSGDHIASYEAYRGSGNRSLVAFERDGNLFQATIPKGSLPAQIGTVEVRDLNPASYSGQTFRGIVGHRREESGYPETGLTPANMFRKITLAGGESAFSLGVDLVFYFRDDNGDGILDGNDISVTQLDAFHEEADGTWTLQSLNRTLDTVNRYLRVTVTQTGTFGLFTFPKPAKVEGLMVSKSGSDASLSWLPVTQDEKGNAISVDHYNIYTGVSPGFYPDLVGGTNLLGQAAGTSATDAGAVSDLSPRFYLVSAVDGSGRESYPK